MRHEAVTFKPPKIGEGIGASWKAGNLADFAFDISNAVGVGVVNDHEIGHVKSP